MTEQINFSGGEIRRGNAVYGTEVWNRDPLPKPPPPKTYTYKLTVQHPQTPTDANKYMACATAKSLEELISFELQMRGLGYEFIRLERMDEATP